VTDLLEWSCITFGCFYIHKGFHQKVDHFRVLFTKNPWILRVFSVLAILFGILWFQIGWDPWDAKRFTEYYPPPEASFEVVWNVCKLLLKNETLLAESIRSTVAEEL